MSIATQFAQVLRILKQDEDEEIAGFAASLPNLPRLSGLLETASLPSCGLLFGVASDGLPVALNLLDPAPGPLLIVGDPGSGKLDFLQVAAQSAAWSQSHHQVQYVIVSSRLETWRACASPPHCLAGISPFDRGIRDILFDLAEWAQGDTDGQSRLLLIDDLSALMHLDGESLENLQWLLAHGPACGLWPIATLETGMASKMPAWLNLFSTRVFGWVENINDAYALAPGSPAPDLLAGAQFCMWQRRGAWLKFFLPTRD